MGCNRVVDVTVKKTGKTIEVDEKLVPSVNIGLVGHVDHGKTSLTQALTGKWTDTHSEELKRGITIRLGYADATFYKCPECGEPDCYSTAPKCLRHAADAEPRRTVSLVDAPGHETLMATVLSGAALMNGALLLIAANEPCPQPQTAEHLMTLDITGIKNIVIVQNKIDLVPEEKVRENYEQIKKFVKGSVAENAPVIPVSAQQKINIDALIMAIENAIPTPDYDKSRPPKMLVVRTFDINKPGTAPEKLVGGVLGGSLVEGELHVGDEIEIRPGRKVEKENKISWEPLLTKITGLQKAGRDIENAGPGGLLGVMTELDPFHTKADSLAGSVAGIPGKLPPVLNTVVLDIHLLERVVGSKDGAKIEPIRTNETLMLITGTTRTAGVVTSARTAKAEISLKLPVCAERGDRVAISRQVAGRWRLIGYGMISK